MAFVLIRNRKKEGVLFGSLKGDPYAITEYRGDSKNEIPVKNKINIMCAIYPENYAEPAAKATKETAESQAESGQEKAPEEQTEKDGENDEDAEKKE